MRKLIFLIIAFLVLNTTFGSARRVIPKINAFDVFLPVGKQGQLVSLGELSLIKVKDYEILTGRNMKFSEKAGYKLVQYKLQKSINPDGSFKTRKFERYLKRSGETGFHTGGFFLGFFLGLIGIIIAYFIKDDYKRNRVKWAWIGWGLWVMIWLVLLLSGAFESLYYY